MATKKMKITSKIYLKFQQDTFITVFCKKYESNLKQKIKIVIASSRLRYKVSRKANIFDGGGINFKPNSCFQEEH